MNPVIRLKDLALSEHAHGSAFEARLAQIAAPLGARRLGARYLEVPPGKKAWPYHSHHANDEMFVILGGRGRLRFGGQDHAVAEGDVVVCPAGGAETGVEVRAWPRGEAVALISHTMTEARAAELAVEYGFDLRTPMDSSIKLCRIAEGAADIYPRHGPTMEWDTAAGHAILVAAGGRFTKPDGGAFVYGKADQGFRNGWFVARGG
ncbi:MAG: hypothetical protein B7X77_08535 [Caulobacter sp. 39-67-4]|nr:MAG: hypothetical protein B7X77_08535 [Caulobacter sp. 39-67-4]